MYLIKTSVFFKSSSKVEECPLPDKPEYALIGRSNVGKSSLLNMLTGRNGLAMVSAKPGKTKLINHFLMDSTWYLVDLPGYGWAKVSKTEKEKWGATTRYYLRNRPNLMYVFVLIDSRLDPQKIDIEFCNWLGENEIPFILVFTKCDKNSQHNTNTNVKKFTAELLKWWESVPPLFLTSSVNKHGKDELLQFIKENNIGFKALNPISLDNIENL